MTVDGICFRGLAVVIESAKVPYTLRVFLLSVVFFVYCFLLQIATVATVATILLQFATVLGWSGFYLCFLLVLNWLSH